MKRKICFIEMNVSARKDFLGFEVINFVGFLVIWISQEDTRVSSRGKFVSVVFRSGNEA